MLRLTLFAFAMVLASAAAAQPPTPEAIDAAVHAAMARTGARGLALAVIEDGQVTSVRTWGDRNEAGDPLEPNTVMYGASLTKAVFAYTVLQMADEGLIDLDRSIADYLPRPLPDYTTPKRLMPRGTISPATNAGGSSPRASCSRTAPASPISPSWNRTGA